jgi:hypothetical protein
MRLNLMRTTRRELRDWLRERDEARRASARCRHAPEPLRLLNAGEQGGVDAGHAGDTGVLAPYVGLADVASIDAALLASVEETKWRWVVDCDEWALEMRQRRAEDRPPGWEPDAALVRP